ncbi:MAG: hypothetical protein IPM48_10350 [Saprospiraceae bacterium]|nr:hypothetical protein [Saprospiraceae bacterium]
MKTLPFALTITILLSSFLGCDLIDDSPCGPRLTYDLYLLGTSVVDNTGDILNTYMEGTNRVLQWSELVEEVCSDEHVKVDYRVAFLDNGTAVKEKMTARGSVSWQFLFERVVNLTADQSDLKGNLEVGLKQAFPDLKGWMVPTLEVIFPTKGSYSADTAYIKKHLIAVEMRAKYREYK